jgi:hypothetical protein
MGVSIPYGNFPFINDATRPHQVKMWKLDFQGQLKPHCTLDQQEL